MRTAVGVILRQKTLAQRIKALFARGEQGAWFDPNDMATLWQDSAGTTPVTALEQPVGLMLDKSKGLVLGSELVGSPISGSASGTWTVTAAGVTRNTSATGQASANLVGAAALPTTKRYFVTFRVSGMSGDSIGIRVGGGTAYNVTADGTYTWMVPGGGSTSFTVIPWAGLAGECVIDNISVRELPGNHASQATSTKRPTLSARVNLLLDTNALATQNVTTAAIPYTLKHDGTGTITLSGTSTAGPLVGAGTLTFTPTAGTLTLTVSGSVTNAQLETGSTATRYQRVTTATDYDSAGFMRYESHDGVDDCMATAAGGGASTYAVIVMGFTSTLAGAAQTLWTDRTGNTGLKLEKTAGNAIAFSGGNGASINTATGDAISIGVPYVVTAIYDGVNLSVQLNNATAVTAACTLSAGQAAITIGADTGAAAAFFKGKINGGIYIKDDVQQASQIADIRRFVSYRSGVAL